MGFKSAVFVLIVGVAIGYFARDYAHEWKSIKNHVMSFTTKASSEPRKEEVPPKNAGKTKSTKDKPPPTKANKDKADKAKKSEERLFTKDELWENYRGEKGHKGLYIAIMGRVYDVAKGEKHYKPGSSYSFFAGRDGTKAYSTGEFNDEGLTDDLTGVDVSHFGEYENWVNFFDTDYTYVGKLIGNFYDENGQPTAALEDAHKMMKEAQSLKDKEKEHEKKFPRCNSEWTQAKGSRVWCTTKSGGIERDWVGVPRLLHPVGQNTAFCVCIRKTGPPTLGHTTEDKNRGDLDYPYLKEYKDCDPNSATCKVNLKD